jgi:predicted ArsR family transcriptional regulator
MAEPSAASGASLAAPNGHRMPASSAATNGASGLRRDLLLHLRLDGPSSPEALAGRLGVSRTGVLQQLRALEAAGLVSRQAVRHGVGRPRHVYDITEAAQELFPTNYDGFANGLLAAIRSIGGDELVRSVFDERRRLARDRIHERLCERLPADASVLDRARELAVIQDDLGYLAEAVIGPDGVIRLVERNCAIHHVAAADGAACQAELDLFREILGPDVERETHIASGDRCCTYRIGAAAPER